MAFEIIKKFQPDRTMYFRGFSGIQCPAGMHSASSTGFTVSGVFRDPADFWVLVIYDVDDFYNHPRIKALPAVTMPGAGTKNLQGVVLEFDVEYEYTLRAGVMVPASASLDVPKFPTIDFPFLDFIRNDGSVGRVDISYANNQTQFTGTTAVGNTIQNNNPTTVSSGTLTAASGTFGIVGSGASFGDKLTLFFENFWWSYGASGGGSDTPANIATYFAAQINATAWGDVIYTLSASIPSAGVLEVTCNQPGSDANMIRLYWTSTNPSNLNMTPNPLQLSGGSSNGVTFHVKLDFSNLVDVHGNAIDDLRQAWLTFAPALADSGPLVDTDVDIAFTNWGITADPNGLSELKVAGPNSVRVEESNAAVKRVGTWTPTNVGWYSQGFAIASSTPGDTLTVTYSCQFMHDLWLGTAVYSDRGVFGITIDGAAQPDLDMMTVTYPGGVVLTPATGAAISEAVSTRRPIAAGIPAGTHTVVLTVKPGDTPPAGIGASGFCYFDFLEAVIASDVPDAPGPWSDRAPAIDYDTQHGYQLAPSRLLWMMSKLGFTGTPIDEYIGVFWWNQRKVVNQTLAAAVVDFTAVGPAPGDALFLVVGATTIGKSVFAGENATTWALHFVYFINETFSGIWAEATAGVLTVHVRSTAAAYQITPFSAYLNTTSSPIPFTGDLTSSTAGTWLVDDTQTPILNHGAATWHSDLYAQAVALGTSIVSSFSLEIVQPPDYKLTPPVASPPVWTSCFKNGDQVITDTGSGGLFSSQCVPKASAFLAYQEAAYLHVAQLQDAAGHPVQLQCGEHLWWFFARLNLVPISFIAILSAVRIDTAPVAHGLTTGDTVLISKVQGLTFVNGEQVVTVIDATHFEIPASGAGPGWVAGTGFVSGGGMAYYDASTAADAVTVLSRALADFWLPTDDPSINSYADANFLANQLNSHVGAMVAYVQGTYPSAVFEILYPGDVNGLILTPISGVGGRLNNWVNLPAAWKSHSTAPFQIFKYEQLAYLTTDRNMDFVKAGLAVIAALDWTAAQRRFLYPVDNAGIAQWDELNAAQEIGFATHTPFAFDQINLIGWAVEPPPEDGAVLVQ